MTDNPLTRVKRATPKMIGQVDPRVVANPTQVRELLTAVTYVGQRNRDRGAHLHAFFATVYYSAARLAEALALRETDCKLPDTGWGELAVNAVYAKCIDGQRDKINKTIDGLLV